MYVSLLDLYYGMMLPSGNNAAFLIAEIGGMLIDKYQSQLPLSAKQIEDFEDPEFTLSEIYKTKNPVYIYLKEMNTNAEELGMASTNFANSHGLSNISSYCTVNDLNKLCTRAMKNATFRQIVGTEKYTCFF